MAAVADDKQVQALIKEIQGLQRAVLTLAAVQMRVATGKNDRTELTEEVEQIWRAVGVRGDFARLK
jgi:hypothetical protein